MALFSQAPRALCILRLSAIGDVCNALAAVQQIQQYWPETHITWVVGKAEFTLLSAISQNIDFVVYDKKAGIKEYCRIWRLLKVRQFDALLNMQTAFRASVLSLGIHAKYKIGFGKQRAREGQGCFTNRKIADPQNPHVLAGFMAFVDYLGVPSQAPTWRLNIPPQAQNAVQQFLDPQSKHLLISPCSSKTEKDWLVERYAEVAQFAVEHGFKVILSGSNAEREQKTCQELTALCQQKGIHLINSAGKTSLVELVALIQKVDLVISPDSAAAHIANMCGTPVIGLYAYHNPQRTGPFYALDKVVSVYEQNAQKEYGKPSQQLAWATKLKGKNLMAQIETAQVIEKIKALLQ